MTKLKDNPIATVLIVTLLLLIVYLITNSAIAIFFALTVGISGLLFNSVTEAIDRLWTKLAGILGLIIPNILLMLVFYLFLTPLAMLARAFGKKNQLNLRNMNASLFQEQKEIFDKAFFERPW
ncbi:hypothetical protein GCM10011386_47990 [Parapedobacter defluvii]|uniref:AI-2E family transporter n=1 Tax=Parapedobacter defluvii TaxID=2045106 RepID=A0ABQ1N0G1_9SPHI|nr:hypothetical protein [Parapedobacter defluvii]GGC50173.1 hypothetical protein GCM10011386_47990 [Parapedobacter defluvii]